jgi:hypothetical protein
VADGEPILKAPPTVGWYRWQGQDLILAVRAQPRARRDAFVGLVGDEMKVALKAPPVDGKANECLLRFLAKALDVPRADVALLSGAQSRSKRVLVKAPARLPAGVESATAGAAEVIVGR